MARWSSWWAAQGKAVSSAHSGGGKAFFLARLSVVSVRWQNRKKTKGCCVIAHRHFYKLLTWKTELLKRQKLFPVCLRVFFLFGGEICWSGQSEIEMTGKKAVMTKVLYCDMPDKCFPHSVVSSTKEMLSGCDHTDHAAASTWISRAAAVTHEIRFETSACCSRCSLSSRLNLSRSSRLVLLLNGYTLFRLTENTSAPTTGRGL